jgi:hypothetical protein
MWWIVGLVVFVAIINWLGNNPPIGLTVVFLAIAAAVYSLYKLILHSPWLEEHDKEQRRTQHQQEEDARNEALLRQSELEWAQYNIPAKENLIADLSAKRRGLASIFTMPDLSDFDYRFKNMELKMWSIPETKQNYRVTLKEASSRLLLTIPEETRFAGTWIVAPSGRGKTNLLHHMIGHDRGKGTVVLMESKEQRRL